MPDFINPHRWTAERVDPQNRGWRLLLREEEGLAMPADLRAVDPWLSIIGRDDDLPGAASLYAGAADLNTRFMESSFVYLTCRPLPAHVLWNPRHLSPEIIGEGGEEGWRLLLREELTCLPHDAEVYNHTRTPAAWINSIYRGGERSGLAMAIRAVYRTRTGIPYEHFFADLPRDSYRETDYAVVPVVPDEEEV